MTRDSFEVVPEPYDSPAAIALTDLVQQDYVERYGGPDRSPIDASDFAEPHGVFLVGYLAGEPVAMGGLRQHASGEMELRRMFVRPDHRGHGLSRVLLMALEEHARRLGATRIVLETGQPQPEALALYRSSGYEPIEGYGFYAESPLSVCLEKRLLPQPGLSG